MAFCGYPCETSIDPNGNTKEAKDGPRYSDLESRKSGICSISSSTGTWK